MNSSQPTGFPIKQRGTTMVEMAILTPVLVMLVFGFVEIGRGLLQTNMLTKSVETGVRFLARYPGAVSGFPHCNAGSEWGDATTQARDLITKSNGGIGGIILPGLDDGAAVTFSRRSELVIGATPEETIATCVIRIQVQTDFVAIFGDSIVPLLNLGPINLNAVAEERYNGF